MQGNNFRTLAESDWSERADAHTVPYTAEEIARFRRDLEFAGNFRRDLDVGECDEETEEDLFGVRGSVEDVSAYFSTPAYHRSFARRVGSSRSYQDCFGTGVLTLLQLEAYLGVRVPMLGIPDADTTRSMEVEDFLAAQRWASIQLYEIELAWRATWTRSAGARLLRTYLHRVEGFIGTQVDPIGDLGYGDSFVFLLGVNQATADIAQESEREMGHWFHNPGNPLGATRIRMDCA